MKTFQQYLKEHAIRSVQLESFDSLAPVPVSFGSNIDFFGAGDSYTDKKFEAMGSGLYRTVFQSDKVWVQVVFDKNNNELLFMTGDTDDITAFDTNKRSITGNIRMIFSNMLYIIPFLIKQLRPTTIMISSKPHTKKIYNYLYSKGAFEKIGLVSVSKRDVGNDTHYTFRVV